MVNQPDSFRIDLSTREVIVGERRVDPRLSPQEFALLQYLYEHDGETCTRQELGDHVWGVGEGPGAVSRYDDHMLHALMHRVRQKLQRVGIDLRPYIVNVAGVGYRLQSVPVRAEPDARKRRLPIVAAAIGSAAIALVAAVLIAVMVIDTEDQGGGVVRGSTIEPTAPVVAELCGSEMISPVPGSVLAGETVTFEWTPGCGMVKYDFWVGCTKNGSDFFDPDDGAFTKATVSGLPVDGGPIYVRLTSSDGSEEGTFSEYYTYTTVADNDSAIVLEVPGDGTSYVDSGIEVSAAQPLEITACGQVFINSAGYPAFKAGGDDACPGAWRPAFTVPELPCWALIGRIGDGTPFLVGPSFTIPEDTPAGRFYLGVNDDNPTDNSGSFRVTVETSP